MRSLISVIVLGLVASSCLAAYINPGKEYVYKYETNVMAGTDDYVSFASSFNIIGKLRIQKVDPTLLTAKLDDLQFSTYNGDYPINTLNIRPEVIAKAYQQLNPLTEPFHVRLNANNLITSIVLSDAIPEWARNIHRGLASGLQLDTVLVGGSETNFEVNEKIVLGECPTVYQVVKDPAGLTVRKQRDHASCQNRVIQVRSPGTVAIPCRDDDTRNVYNSTGFGIYAVSNFNGEAALSSVILASHVRYAIFGPKGVQQFSLAKTTCGLEEIKSSGFSRIGQPSSPRTFDNLRYVFESKFAADDSLESPTPYYAHLGQPITDEGILKEASDKVYENVQKMAEGFETTKVYDDVTAFHSATPFSVIPGISILPYNHLKSLYARVKQDNKYSTQKIFLDSLVVSGTGPAALLIRDIVGSTTDFRTTANLIVPFPAYVRNPTEKLLDEFEGLIKTDLPKHNLRVIEFAFASLISRTCQKYQCQKGYVEKYVQYFWNKYENGATFEDKTVGVIGLRNLGIGSANAKLISIVANPNADRSIRAAAISGIHRSISSEQAKEVLLPLFYDRNLHQELRTKAAVVFIVYHYEENVVAQMVGSLWTEPCPYVKNFMYTLLEGFGNSKSPCFEKNSGHARTLLRSFIPWKLDRTRSSNYIRDFDDPEFHFGHSTILSLNKDGDSVVPISIYGSLKGHIGGYGASYLSFFARLEGVGKAVADRVMSMSTGQISFDQVKSVFAKIGVVDRTPTPLRLEFALLLHNRVVAYHAADASTVTTIPQMLKKLQEMKSSYELELSRLFILGGVRIEQPTEFGTPISVTSSIAAHVNINIKTNREKTGTSIAQTSDWHFQTNLFGLSRFANHFPALNTVHEVVARRGLRTRVPRKFNLNFDHKALSFNFGIDTPTKEDPLMAMSHATVFTSIGNDNRAGNGGDAVQILKSSCSRCSQHALVTKGAEFRGERQIGLPDVSQFKLFEGVRRGAKYFDCEKPHSRYDTIKRLAKFISEDSKNSGTLSIVRVLLAIQHARDFIFLSPTTQTCGIKAYYHRDPNAKSIFEKVDATLRLKYAQDPNKKLGTRVQFKGLINFKHGGAEPQSRTVDVTGQVVLTGIEKREVKIRFGAKDEKTGKSGVLCIETHVQQTKPEDFFGIDGPNEPTFDRKVILKWGEEPAGKDACPENAGYIKATRNAHRSQEQLEEVRSNNWPYKDCRDQKSSAHWPGQLTPPTHECMQVAVDQTKLRESNITIEYQVDVEARNRWKKPAVAFAAFLLPYWDTDRSGAAAHVHSTHVETRSGSEYLRGSVEIDVSARKVNPSLDIHWHASHGDEHFHNVDLAAIPGPLQVKPVFSRFSPFWMEMFKVGLFGYCASSPSSVITFDNYTYHGGLTECPTLLAGDCDDKPRFAVLINKIGADRVGLTVYLGEHKLEMTDINTITVDGKPQPVTDSVYTDDDEEKLFKFVKFTPTYVAILSEKLSIYIGYSGSWATVTAGSRYRGTACGLCGNFDNVASNDFNGPDNRCSGLGADSIIKAYTVRDGNCGGVGSPCPV